MKRAVLISTMIMCSLATMTACQRGPENIDISSVHTSAATDTSESKEGTDSSDKIVIDSESASSVSKITSTTETYENMQVSVQYPQVSGLADPEKEKKVNALLKNNALSIISVNSLDEENDKVSITCEIVSSERSQLTAIYTGTVKTAAATYPTNVFYSNTVDTDKVEDIGFDRYADSQSMAAYVLSSECELVDVSADVENEVREYLAGQKQDSYASLFRSADFPIKTSGKNKTSKFPESFSYANQGAIYFSVPVPHALGDYVLIRFTPETK